MPLRTSVTIPSAVPVSPAQSLRYDRGAATFAFVSLDVAQ